MLSLLYYQQESYKGFPTNFTTGGCKYTGTNTITGGTSEATGTTSGSTETITYKYNTITLTSGYINPELSYR